METSVYTKCCIVGGGPAGIMAGYLLARAGIDVVVLEKHKDFNRDFRGDTIHPSTFQIMAELGLLDEFLKVRHTEVPHLRAMFNETEVEIGDFTHLKVARPVLGIMPQWDFLNFITGKAKQYNKFRLIMEANVNELLWEKGRVAGIATDTPEGTLHVFADVVIGADGRSSLVREQARLKVIKTGVLIDVLWFRLTKTDTDPTQTLGRFYHGSIMILIDRFDYWQGGYVIEKNGFDKIKEQGIDQFRKELLKVTPFLGERVQELKSWDDIKLLSVAIDHLELWYCDGLLCIGDAAHAMSPVGGVGINLAIQDAVATANILYKHLHKKEKITEKILAQVQKRRAMPARMVQMIQMQIHKGIAHSRVNETFNSLPLPFRLLKAFPILRRIPAKLVGMGIRPEHIRTPEVRGL